MIVVKKGYYFIDEVLNYCQKYKKYQYLTQILYSLKAYGEKYVSSDFFYNEMKEIKNELTDLTNYFNIKYFRFYNTNQEKKLLEYFDYKIPKYVQKAKAIHLYNEKVVELLKEGYVLNILGYYLSINNLKQSGIMLLDYDRIISLESKNPKNRKKLFIGAWK